MLFLTIYLVMVFNHLFGSFIWALVTNTAFSEPS